MILLGLSAETLTRLLLLSRYGEDFSGLLVGCGTPPAEPAMQPANDAAPAPPLAAE